MRVLKKEVWPHQVTLRAEFNDNLDNEIYRWCTGMVGLRFKEWYSYSQGQKERVYAFKDEATLLVFKLKWGNYGISRNV